MKPYYEDESVTLYHGRCEVVLPTLSLTGSVHLLTDPPYFKVKDNDWDNQWSKSAEFLDWMGDWLDLAKPHLSPDASVWVFASPQMTSAVESIVASRFRVLNSIRWRKETSPAQKGWGGVRAFIPMWEGILFAEQASDDYASLDYAGHKDVFIEAGAKLSQAREAAGLSRTDLAGDLLHLYKNLDTAKAMMSDWEIGKSCITADAHAVLSRRYELPAHSDLRDEYRSLQARFEGARRPFAISERQMAEDIWHFPSVASYPGKHVCEKPVGLLTHMIETTTRPGDTIIDCFAGSGAVLDVARQLGRKAVGIEMDEHWCRQATKRLSQQAFDFGEIA